jgi:hypothetical protein
MGHRDVLPVAVDLKTSFQNVHRLFNESRWLGRENTKQQEEEEGKGRT